MNAVAAPNAGRVAASNIWLGGANCIDSKTPQGVGPIKK
jgi:hypothetical protein